MSERGPIAGRWTRRGHTLELRRIGVRLVGWLTAGDDAPIAITGLVIDDGLELVIDGETVSARLGRTLTIDGGTAQGRWTRVELPDRWGMSDDDAHDTRQPASKAIPFTGTWLASGSVGQDTASWYSRLTITEDATGRIIGTQTRWIEGWNPDGGPTIRENEQTSPIEGRRTGARATITIERDGYTLERETDRLVLVNRYGRRDAHALQHDPQVFAGTWRVGGSIPQDTGSWEYRLVLRVVENRLTGRFHDTREGLTCTGAVVRERDEVAELSGLVVGDTAHVTLGDDTGTLRIEGDSLTASVGAIRETFRRV